MYIMNVKIREYQNSDYDSVDLILKNNFQVNKAKCKDANVLEFVAVKDEKVVGYFIMRRLLDIVKNSKWFYLEYVCVDKDYQNQGIGSKMLDFVIKFAQEEKASYIELTSGYKREVAHHLYEKVGFEKRESNIFRRML